MFEEIIRHGEVVRGWVGIGAAEISPQQTDNLNLGSARAMLITGVDAQGPAAAAGIRAGDIITDVNGEAIVDGRQVLDLISNTAPGEQISFEIIREQERLELRVRAASRPNS